MNTSSPRPLPPGRQRARLVLFGVGSVAAVVVAGLVLWVAVGPGAVWVLRNFDKVLIGRMDPAELSEALDRVRGRAVAIGTGLLAAVAIFFTARTARAALDSSSAAQQTAAATERGMVTGRFTAAVTQLGDANPAVQLGSVHALAGIADDEPSMRQTCIDVLCAYLRLPYDPDPGEAPKHAEERKRYRGRREVRHTIIRLIGHHLRLSADHPHSWQGCDFDFTSVVFDGGDFSGAHFSSGTVNFTGAEFSGGWVSFGDVRFSGGRVDFELATFSSSTVNFTGAEFSGGWVSFGLARFSGGRVSFGDVRFSGGRVTFKRATFSSGRVDFRGARFSGGLVSFGDAGFSGGTVDFQNPQRWEVPPAGVGAEPGGVPPAGVLLPEAG